MVYARKARKIDSSKTHISKQICLSLHYLQFTIPRTLRDSWTGIPRIGLIPDLLASNIWRGLFVDDETGGRAERLNGFLLNAINEVRTSGDVVDEPDHLSCCPDLRIVKY